MTDIHKHMNSIHGALFMVLPLKDGKGEAELTAFMKDKVPACFEAFKSVGTMQFFRVFMTDKPGQAVIAADFDGTLDQFCADYGKAVGSSFFAPLFEEFLAEVPPLPIEDNIAAFTEFVKKHDAGYAYNYSEFHSLTVKDLYEKFGNPY
jgi:hypothetical protein